MRSADTSPSRPPRAREALRGAGLDRLDAEVLLAHVLSVSRAVLQADDPSLSPAQAARFAELAERRREGEPVAYLVGSRGFRWLELVVDRRVLIPRPETEHLVEVALGLPAGARVVDVGTGSGAVALALKHERPDLSVTGTDISPDALDVARANGERLGLEVEWVEGDLLGGVRGEVDAVVANLPYVEEGAVIEEGVRHEPPLALWGGADGLDVIRRLLTDVVDVVLAQRKESRPRPGPPSFLALEVGAGQAAEVAAVVRGAGYREVEIHPDLAGHDRIVVAKR